MRAAAPDPLLGYVIDHRYTLLRSLGAGGMGAVYRAMDSSDGKEVALKLLKPPEGGSQGLLDQLHRRMKREIKVLLLVEDERVIQLLDWGRDEGFGLYYTMELLPQSKSLGAYIKAEDTALPARLWLLREILEGLASIHQVGAIHRDLKPDNILVTPLDGVIAVKIIDPGIAKWFDDNLKETLAPDTAPGNILGTPLYMAPEMWSGDGVDAQTDVYQMALVAFEILTDTLPFAGNFYNLMLHHMQTELPPLPPLLQLKYPHISEHLAISIDAVLRQGAEKPKAKRHANASAFAAAIGELLQEALAQDPARNNLHQTLAYRDVGAFDVLESIDALEAARYIASRPHERPLPSGTALLATPSTHGQHAYAVAEAPGVVLDHRAGALETLDGREPSSPAPISPTVTGGWRALWWGLACGVVVIGLVLWWRLSGNDIGGKAPVDTRTVGQSKAVVRPAMIQQRRNSATPIRAVAARRKAAPRSSATSRRRGPRRSRRPVSRRRMLIEHGPPPPIY